MFPSNGMGESTEQAISITWYPLTMQKDNIVAASIGFEKKCIPSHWHGCCCQSSVTGSYRC